MGSNSFCWWFNQIESMSNSCHDEGILDEDSQRLLKAIGIPFDEPIQHDEEGSLDEIDPALELLKHMIDCVTTMGAVIAAYRKQGTTQNAVKKAGGNILKSFAGELGRLLQFTLNNDWDAQGEDKALEFIEISELIMQSFPDFASRRQKHSGKTLLHQAAHRSCRIVVDSTFQSLLKCDPTSASTTDFLGAIPLHWAMRNPKSCFEVADVLLQAYPEGVQAKDNQGLTPLHWAVSQDNPNIEVIRGLLEICPAAASMTCDKGGTALHYCVNRTTGSVSIPTVAMLLRAAPETVKATCEEGWLPIHRCVNRSEPDVEALKILIKSYPCGLLHKNQDGQVPLHKAVDHTFPSTDTLTLLLESCPEAAEVADMEGYLPLHLILDCSSPDLAAAEKVLRTFPEAACKPTLDGLLPLHFVLASNDEPSLEFICTLLQADPYAPFHLAIDYVPEDENSDPDTWEGLWVEKHWTPITRALDRGLSEIATILRSGIIREQQQQEQQGDDDCTQLNKPSSPTSVTTTTTSEATSSTSSSPPSSTVPSPLVKVAGNKTPAGLTPLNTNLLLQSQRNHCSRYPFRPFPVVGSISSVGRSSLATEHISSSSWRGGPRATPRSGRLGSSIPSTPGSVRRWARRDQDHSDIGSGLHVLPSADRCFIEEEEFWDDEDEVTEFTTVYVQEDQTDGDDDRPSARHLHHHPNHNRGSSFIHAHHSQSNGHILIDNSRGATGGTSRASLWPEVPSSKQGRQEEVQSQDHDRDQTMDSPLSGTGNTQVLDGGVGGGDNSSAVKQNRRPLGLPVPKKSFSFQSPFKKGAGPLYNSQGQSLISESTSSGMHPDLGHIVNSSEPLLGVGEELC